MKHARSFGKHAATKAATRRKAFKVWGVPILVLRRAGKQYFSTEWKYERTSMVWSEQEVTL